MKKPKALKRFRYLPANIGRNAKTKLVAFPETGQREAEALFNSPFAQIALGLYPTLLFQLVHSN